MLKEKLKYTLNQKIDHSIGAIEQFYNAMNGNIYISFSGGKDSTVLLHLVRKIYPDIPGVFSDTGLEFPEIREFVKTKENITWIKPRRTFKKVIDQYGYPYPSKEVAKAVYQIKYSKSEKLRNKRLYGDKNGDYGKLANKWRHLLTADFEVNSFCCYHLKKAPFIKYEKISGNHPVTGSMASESKLRKTNYIRHGCNNIDSKHPISNPLSIWTDSDIWEYIKKYKLPYSKIYDMGYSRTGCMFCLFGIHYEKSDLFEKNRIQKLKETHPKQYKYIIEKLHYDKLLEAENINYK